MQRSLVVIHHANSLVFVDKSWINFGFAGVDIFFVISGFVMAHSTQHLRAPDFSGRIACFSLFFRKRLIRIVPLYWLALLFTSRRELMHGNISLDLIKDLFFIPHANSIYTDSLMPTLLQGWTLNYEMFFYLLFGLSLLLVRFRTVVILVVLLFLANLGFYLNYSVHIFDLKVWQDILLRFCTNSVMLEFAYGIIAQQLIVKLHLLGLPRFIYFLFAIIGFILLALFADEYHFRGITVGISAAIITLSIALVCIGLQQPLLKLLGDASYAIYLFHRTSFAVLKPFELWLNGGSGGVVWSTI